MPKQLQKYPKKSNENLETILNQYFLCLLLGQRCLTTSDIQHEY